MRYQPLVYLSCLMLLGAGGALLSTGAARDTQSSPGVKPAFANEVSITVEGGVRTIRSNGIPDHDTGEFPNRGNPNTIAPQNYEFHIPAEPKMVEQITPMRMQPFGVAVNGVVFDPGAAEWWHGDHKWQYEPLGVGQGYLGVDSSNAHVQPNGAYHYHGIPTALVYALTDGKEKMVLVGWAADGFPIYNAVAYADPKNPGSAAKQLKSSYRVKKGTRPDGPGGAYDGTYVADYEYVAGAGDLDECNGITSATPEYPHGIYHYVLTERFPFIPRAYHGTPDPSFARHGPRGGGQGPGGGPGRRPPLPAIVRAIDANGDGIISAEEMVNAPAAMKSLDKNGDGQLTSEEYLGPPPGRRQPEGGAADSGPNAPPASNRPRADGPADAGPDGPPGGGRPPIPRIVRALDLDGDGIISAEEIAKAAESLKKLDANGDGKLTPEEYLGPRPPRVGPEDAGPDGPPGDRPRQD